MTKKTQAPPQTPEEIAQTFLKLWQDKWQETLQQKGWPKDMPPPSLGHMPFFNPFMPTGQFGTPFAPPSDTEARIAALEKRIAALEKTSPKKPAAKSSTKPLKKAAKKAAKA